MIASWFFPSRVSTVCGPRVLALLAVVVALAVGAPARADHDEDPIKLPACGYLAVGAGPVFGGSFGAPIRRGYRLFGGWEVTGGCPWARLSLGGTYRTAEPGERRERLHWASWDPGLGVGAVVGAAHSNLQGVSPLLGAWLGLAGPASDELRQRGSFGVISRVCASVSLTYRVRWGTGHRHISELLISPKVHYCMHPDFFT